MSDSRARRILHGPSLIIAGGTIAGALLADSAPTGLGWWDATLRAATVGLAAHAATRTGRLPIVFAGLVAALFAESDPWALVAVVGVAGQAAAPRIPVDEAPVRAFGGATACLAAMHLGAVGPFTGSVLVGVVAVAPIVAVALVGLDGESVRRVRGVVAAIIALMFLATVASGIGALQVRDQSVDAVDQARAGLDAVRRGDQGTALAFLERASVGFAEAEASASRWWMQPGRLVPVTGQHVDAVDELVSIGADVAEAARVALTEADVDDLIAAQGRIDLDAMEAMRTPLRELADSLAAADATLDGVDEAWLIPPLREGLDELDVELDEAAPEARRAADAVEVFPGLLGADGPQTLLVIVGTPAETRELGGIIGNWLEVVVADGTALIVDQGRNGDLNLLGPSSLDDPDTYPVRYVENDPETFVQNWTATPDFPTVARAVADMYADLRGGPVDAVAYLDPAGVAALLRLIGPIDLGEPIGRIDANNVEQLLYVDQYALFPERSARADVLADVAERAFARLLVTDLPGPRTLGDVLGPATRGDHLLYWAFDARAQPLLTELGIDGGFDGDCCPGADQLAVVQAAGGASKLDAYLYRSIVYGVDVSAEGELSATADVNLRNTAPDDLPPSAIGPGETTTNTVHLSVYSPHELVELTVDGAVVDAERQEEYGLVRWLVFVDVPAGGEVAVRFDFAGQVDLSNGSYDLELRHQPMVNPDAVTVDLSLRGAVVDAGPGDGLAEFSETIALREDVAWSVPLRRD
ncbi:MAG: DUF4012 domain-containing protein [Actinomycetota bacterium]